MNRLGKVAFNLCLCGHICSAAPGDQWRLTAHAEGSGNGLLALASDGAKVRLIDSTTVYSSNLAGRSLRAVASFGDLQDISHAGGLWVITGNQGKILSSTDGNVWERRTSGTSSTLGEVAGGDDGWIALLEGQARYLHSPDGITWTIRDFDNSFYPDRIAWAGGRWIAASVSQNRTSLDGINWSPAASPGSSSLSWTGDRWLSIDNGTVRSSVDGISWSEQPGSVVFSTSIAGHGDQAVALGFFGRTYRKGAANWEPIPPIQEDGLLDVIWTGTHFVAVGHGSLVLSSADGTSWEIQRTKPQDHFTAVGAGPGGFVAVTSGSTAFFSHDGVNWTQAPTILGLGLSDVAWCIDRWYAVGGEIIFSSTDGLDWSQRHLTAGYLRSVATNGQKTVAVGSSGVVLLKDETHDWEAVDSPASSQLNCVTWGGGWFVAGGPGGTVVRSNDGLNWTSSNSGISMNDIAWTGSTFVAVGSGGAMLTSSDGVSWTPVTNPGTGEYRAVLAKDGSVLAFSPSPAGTWRREADGSWSRLPHGGTAAVSARGITVVTGNQGFISTSADERNWTIRSGPGGGGPIARGAGRIVGCTSDGFVTTSEGGETWTTRPTGAGVALEDVCWGQEGFMAVGKHGTVCRSHDGLEWTVSTLPGEPWLLEVEPFRGGYLAVSNTGQTAVYSPADGWTMGQLTAPNGSSAPRSLAAGPDSAICVTFSNYLLSSEDGLTWSYRVPAEANVVWDGNRFLSSSSAGVRTSPDGIAWTLQDQATFPRGYWHGRFNDRYFVSPSALDFLAGSPESGWLPVTAPTPGYEPSIVAVGSKLVAVFGSGTAVSGGTLPVPFSEWAIASGIAPDTGGFGGDLNGDGVANGIAYLLGAENGRSLLPDSLMPYQSLRKLDGQWVWEVRRPWPSPGDIVQALSTSANLGSSWTRRFRRDRKGWFGIQPSPGATIVNEGEWEWIRIPIEHDVPREFMRAEAELVD